MILLAKLLSIIIVLLVAILLTIFALGFLIISKG